jgi:hypothetical protein
MKQTSLLAALSLAALALSGCDALSSGGFNCTTQETAYTEEVAQHGILQADIPALGPFPMALVLSTDGVNALLSTILDQQLPMLEEDINDLLTIRFQPELPRIQIASVGDCVGCVLTSMDFEIEVGNNFLGFTNGGGGATLALPIALAPVDNRSTALMAMMDEARFMDLSLSIAGLSTDDSQLVKNFLTDLATDYVREELGSQEISRINSWELGQGEMALAARGPMIFGDQGTLLIGMQSNLSLPETVSLEEQATLPPGAQIGLQIHPGMLLGVTQRLMAEGSIASSYDVSGEPEDDGDHQVSLMAMDTDTDSLSTVFRVWRTGGGLCGFVDLASSMSMTVDTQAVSISVDDIAVVDGEGSGSFLSENAWLASGFMDSLTDALSLTMNYRDFAVEGEKRMAVPSATSLNIDNRGLTVFLNLGIEEK